MKQEFVSDDKVNGQTPEDIAMTLTHQEGSKDRGNQNNHKVHDRVYYHHCHNKGLYLKDSSQFKRLQERCIVKLLSGHEEEETDIGSKESQNV